MLPPYGLDCEKHFGYGLVMSMVSIAILAEATLQVSMLLTAALGVAHNFTGFVLMGLGAQVEDLLASVSLVSVLFLLTLTNSCAARV